MSENIKAFFIYHDTCPAAGTEIKLGVHKSKQTQTPEISDSDHFVPGGNVGVFHSL